MHASAPPRPLFGLVGAQALGMFSDNLFKMLAVLLLVGPRRDEASQQTATFSAFLAYTLPYVLLSIPAGVIADAYSKRGVLLGVKVLEALVLVQAGLALSEGNSAAVLTALAVLGTLSAISSPTKYGLIPELVPVERLARGNGVFLLASWIATILGTGVAGLLLDVLSRDRLWQLGIALGALACLGVLFARRIPPPTRRDRPAARTLVGTARAGWSAISASRSLRLAVAGSTAFWTLGALLQQDVVVYSASELRLSDTGRGLLQAALAVGIGVGSLLCGYLTHGRLGTRWVARGGALLGSLLVALGLTSPSTPITAGLLFLAGVSSGLVIVPLNSLAQGRSSEESRGAVIAVLNVFVFSGVLLGSTAGALFGTWGLSSTTIFVVGGGAALVAALWARVARERLGEPLPSSAPL